MKILAVCGMGLGSSLVMRMQMEKVLKEVGLKAEIEVVDISSARGMGNMHIDLIVTSEELLSQLGDLKVPILTIRNLLDLNELRTKLIPIVQSFSSK
jgi:PTS system ascorbate-specific IIB component